jgi:hypothetical protein
MSLRTPIAASLQRLFLQASRIVPIHELVAEHMDALWSLHPNTNPIAVNPADNDCNVVLRKND